MATFNLDTSKIIITLGNEDFFAENLEQYAHAYFLDMLVVYKQIVQNDEQGFTTRTILPAEVAESGLTMADLDRIAKENTARILPAKCVDFNGMTIVTNESGSMGASAVLYSDLVAEIANGFGSDVYLIPSSIHEFIVLPVGGFDVQSLCEMIREANSSVVRPKEVLSDHPYIYRRESAQIAVA